MLEENILDSVFERTIQISKVFKDRDVLRHDYLPGKLPHREGQIMQLGETIAPVLRGARCSNVLIYGKTGTGKTAVVTYVLNHLESKAKEIGASIRFSYVNCRLASTEYRVFASLCQDLGIVVPFTGLSAAEVFDRFQAGLNSSKTTLIIVLDEVDALIKARGDVLLYELTRINESLSKSKVSLVGISNDLRLKELLDPRVLSSLNEEEMVFRPYDASELRNILSERSALSFVEGVLSEAALSLCSALAAAEHGDARRALDLLRIAGEVAERQDVTNVVEDHVREAEKHIEHNRVFEALKNLTLHSKLVILSVYSISKAEIQKMVTGELYEVYTELCVEVGVVPLTQRRFGSLVNELDSMGLLNAKVTSMGRYGRTKRIRLEIARGIIKDAFSGDSRLGRLIDYMPNCLSKHASQPTNEN